MQQVDKKEPLHADLPEPHGVRRRSDDRAAHILRIQTERGLQHSCPRVPFHVSMYSCC